MKRHANSGLAQTEEQRSQSMMALFVTLYHMI